MNGINEILDGFDSSSLVAFKALADVTYITVVPVTPEITGTTYYVDFTGGLDTNDGLSEGQAFKTVSKAFGTSVSGNDGILFKAGETWDISAAIDFTQSGTAGNPIIIGKYGTGNHPIITTEGHSQSSTFRPFETNYVDFYEMDFQGSSTSFCVYAIGCTYTNFYSCNIGWHSNKGIQMSGTNGCQHCIVDHCTIDSGVLTMTHGTLAREGFLAQIATSNNLTLSNCTIRDWEHASVNVYLSNSHKIFNNYISGENMPLGTGVGEYDGACKLTVDGSSCTDNEVYNNTFYRTSGACQINGHRNHVHHNMFIETRQGLGTYHGNGIEIQGYDSSTTGNIIENNVFHSTDGHAIVLSGNNSGGDNRDHIIQNNVMLNCGTVEESGIAIAFDTGAGTDATNITVSNNDIYNSGTVNTCHFFGSTMDVATYNTQSGVSGNIPDEPEFTSISDYHPQVGSPLIGSGVDPVSTIDYDGNTIVSPYNIGLYDTPKA